MEGGGKGSWREKDMGAKVNNAMQCTPDEGRRKEKNRFEQKGVGREQIG